MDEAWIRAAEAFVRELFSGNAGGHDVEHTLRVFRNAMRLADTEPGCDRTVVALGALLHDADDHKLFHTEGNANARAFLASHQVPGDMVERIADVINGVSFSQNQGRTPATLEGRIVQDADRLDAMGAVGIARTFAFGGEHGRGMEESLRHFDEKLLRLKALMNTPAGRQMAEGRHAFMEAFLQEYAAETEEA